MPTKTLAEIIPRSLTMTTGQRCDLVADIIEYHPEQWDQEVWVAGDDRTIVGAGASCGTSCCAFGWAAATTYGADLSEEALVAIGQLGRYYLAGREALGLESVAADLISDPSNKREPLVAALRFLATLPESERTGVVLKKAGFTHEHLNGKDGE